MIFIEHGIYEIKVKAGLLLVDATGPFNEETIISYKKALESSVKQLETSKWNQIIVLRQLSLFTPGAEQALTENLIERKSRGLENSAVIGTNLMSKSMVMKQMSRCYDTANIAHQYFNTLADAKAWLASRL